MRDGAAALWLDDWLLLCWTFRIIFSLSLSLYSCTYKAKYVLIRPSTFQNTNREMRVCRRQNVVGPPGKLRLRLLRALHHVPLESGECVQLLISTLQLAPQSTPQSPLRDAIKHVSLHSQRRPDDFSWGSPYWRQGLTPFLSLTVPSRCRPGVSASACSASGCTACVAPVSCAGICKSGAY